MKTVNIKLSMVVALLLTGGNLLAQYDPQMGRFHQRDPFAINPGAVMTTNSGPRIVGTNGPAPGGGMRPQVSPHAQAMTDLAQINAINAQNRLRQTALAFVKQ